jgi:rhodanese-related sulfurtransferase
MVRVIKIDELKRALDEGRVAELYDNRGPGSFNARHIKGAKLLPVSEAEAGKGLPENKDAMLVFY